MSTRRLDMSASRVTDAGKFSKFELTERQVRWLRRNNHLYTADELAGMMGVSASSVNRLRRKLGLRLTPEQVSALSKRLYEQKIRHVLEENGYYDSLRGQKPSPQCIEASKRMIAEMHPLARLRRKSPEKYDEMCKRWGENRKKLLHSERIRYIAGLDRRTRLRVGDDLYRRSQLCRRSSALKRGYILGDSRERFGERFVIYWDSETERSAVFERNLAADGFTVKELKEEEEC